MLWYKAWLETRWRFAIGLGLLSLSACGTVIYYPQIMQLMPMARGIEVSGELGRRIQEGVDLARTYRGYIWSQVIRQNLAQMGTLFAVLLGTGGLLGQSSGGAMLFTLSMPVSRNRVLGVRAAAGLAEWLVLAFVPLLLISVISPAVGQRYNVGDALVHGACLFVTGAAFFSLAFLLSTIFTDLWRPLLIACAIAVALAVGELIVSPYGVFRIMSAESWFRTGHLPWAGLIVTTAASGAMLYGAAVNLARVDF